MKLVECIANFSEGRREAVVNAIVASIESVDGIQLLDRHSDEDHNRAVITFIGPPKATSEAAYAGIAKAAELIDMEKHEGEHPRLGATDVVPFVPIREVTMDECVELARELGQRVAHDLGIPPDLTNVVSAPDKGAEYARAFIENGTDRMPNYNFTTTEIDDLVHFLEFVAASGQYPARDPVIRWNGMVAYDGD